LILVASDGAGYYISLTGSRAALRAPSRPVTIAQARRVSRPPARPRASRACRSEINIEPGGRISTRRASRHSNNRCAPRRSACLGEPASGEMAARQTASHQPSTAKAVLHGTVRLVDCRVGERCRACIGVGDCDATERSSAKHVRTLSLGKISDVATVVKAGLYRIFDPHSGCSSIVVSSNDTGASSTGSTRHLPRRMSARPCAQSPLTPP
jgi:hypothetical protein